MVPGLPSGCTSATHPATDRGAEWSRQNRAPRAWSRRRPLRDVRRDNGDSYEELRGLAQESGIETPTREDLARLDRKRRKKGCNRTWVNPHDRDARITRMKDGRTHLAHKAEHAVDMETGAVVAVT